MRKGARKGARKGDYVKKVLKTFKRKPSESIVNKWLDSFAKSEFFDFGEVEAKEIGEGLAIIGYIPVEVYQNLNWRM